MYNRMTGNICFRNTHRYRYTGGFTLVELLVVISIIAFLASIILASLHSVRIKADNSVRLQTIQEYVKAIYFILDSNGGNPMLSSWSDLFCIGVYPPTGKCAFFGEPTPTWLTDEQLNDNFKTYLPSLPTLKRINVGNKKWDGPMYGCGRYISGSWEVGYSFPCTPILKWVMDGNNQLCLPGAEIDNSYDGVTLCILPVF